MASSTSSSNRPNTIVLANGMAAYDTHNCCFFIMSEVDGSGSPARMVACGTATPTLHGTIAVGTDPMVVGLSDTGVVWMLVVNVAVPCSSHVHFEFADHKFVRLVAAQGHTIIAVTVAGLVVMLNTIHITCTTIATVEPDQAHLVSGDFAKHEPGLVVLLGVGGRCVVAKGVGVLPAARLSRPDPPKLTPLACACTLVEVSAAHGLTVVAAGTRLGTFTSSGVDPKMLPAGLSVVQLHETVAIKKLADPIIQACSNSANHLVAVTRAGILLIIVPEELGAYRTNVASSGKAWADVRESATGSLLAVCRDVSTHRLLPPIELVIT